MSEASEAPDSTAVRYGSPCGGRCTSRSMRRPTCSRTVGRQPPDPEPGWRERGDMHPEGTAQFRASIVARARFVEDLVGRNGPTRESRSTSSRRGGLGAGLDTLRATPAGTHVPPAGVRSRPARYASVEATPARRARLRPSRLVALRAGRLRPGRVVVGAIGRRGLGRGPVDRRGVPAGVTMYLTREANAATLREVAALAPDRRS